METLQRDIQPNMRAILMDWVVEVATEYKLVSDTLFLAASFVDRYLSCRAIDRTQLQLVGVAALFLAAKYEEIYPPQLNDFVFVAASTYTREQVRSFSPPQVSDDMKHPLEALMERLQLALTFQAYSFLFSKMHHHHRIWPWFFGTRVMVCFTILGNVVHRTKHSVLSLADKADRAKNVQICVQDKQHCGRISVLQIQYELWNPRLKSSVSIEKLACLS